ncbi:MAG: signal peptidase II [Lachnospiraceae bacterium]|jgi:signal peptidase II|nr:signal peptidase II [Lachnospiraceae bacterium]
MKDKMINLLSLLCGSALLVWLDQYTKHLAVAKLKGQEPFSVVPGVFELLYSENRGAAFGMLQGRQGFFFVVGIVVLAAAVYVMVRMPSYGCSRYHFLKVCTVMITAGAVGNMVDRVSQGYVVDFLYFRLIDFPIFNVADIYVTTATGLLLVLFLFYYKDEDFEIFRPGRRKGE